MTGPDPFADLARYYDPLMGEVDYDRWLVVTSSVAELVRDPKFRHIDLACGTGRLLKRLVQHGWNSVGIDLSHAMLREARKGPFAAPVAVADVARAPFRECFHYATCVFDSLNFLLEPELLRDAFASVRDLLQDDGVFYFDAITERMVIEHFADQTWAEDNGPFSTTWEGRYDRSSGIAELDIRVNTGPVYRVRERVYSADLIADALGDAGLTMLGVFDAETWKSPGKRTIRLDYVVARNPSRETKAAFKRVAKNVCLALA